MLLKRRGYKGIADILVIGVMLLIFIFSAQPATTSRALSDQFINLYKLGVEKIPFLSDTTKVILLAKSSHYVRKLAHLTIFAVLGSTTLFALWQKKKYSLNCIWIALFICFIYAALDEWHQYYVAGRGAQLSDVIIDTVGASIGILGMELVHAIGFCFRRKKYKTK